MDRTTVSRDWHKQAPEDAGLRDMPLHSLRHTAAASWLLAGQPLIYVQRHSAQLDHDHRARLRPPRAERCRRGRQPDRARDLGAAA
jgi:integrase